MTGKSAPIAILAAAALAALWGCGEAPPAGEPMAADPAPVAAAPADGDAAEALFAETCLGLTASQQVCACVRERVVEASGLTGLGYIGAAYGGQAALAEPYEAQMSQAERNVAAEAFLDGQFDCVIAQDPDYAPAPDAQPAAASLAQGAEESPFEQAVGACVSAGAAPEPECRCRVQSAFDALGQDGVLLARAAESADDQTMAALADEHGLAWLGEGRIVLQEARTQCAP